MDLLPSGILLKWIRYWFQCGGLVTIMLILCPLPPLAALLTVQLTTLDTSHSYNMLLV